MAFFGRSVVVIGVSLLTGLALQASNLKLAKDLPAAGASSTVDVIIQFTSPIAESHHARVKQHGGSLKRELGIGE